MLDLNHILLFLAIVSPVVVLARTWRPGPRLRAWRIAALAVLIVTGIAWLFFRTHAGYIAGGAWFALLFVPAVGMRKVADLAMHRRYRPARRLATLLRVLHPSDELRHEIEMLRLYEARPDLAIRPRLPNELEKIPARGLQRAPAVLVLILLNAAAFIFELTRPHWQDAWTLHRLGALEPFAVIHYHQYWRLFTALFLHFDVFHVGFNLFALYVLGPALERAIGTWRFVACYLISGLGSSMGVVWLTQLHVTHAEQLVGASGCIMGIVGAWGAYLLLHRHMPMAKQRLLNVAMIVIIQTAFDLSTPQISMAAHLCGLAAGFVIGLALAPRNVAPAP